MEKRENKNEKQKKKKKGRGTLFTLKSSNDCTASFAVHLLAARHSRAQSIVMPVLSLTSCPTVWMNSVALSIFHRFSSRHMIEDCSTRLLRRANSDAKAIASWASSRLKSLWLRQRWETSREMALVSLNWMTISSSFVMVGFGLEIFGISSLASGLRSSCSNLFDAVAAAKKSRPGKNFMFMSSGLVYSVISAEWYLSADSSEQNGEESASDSGPLVSVREAPVPSSERTWLSPIEFFAW